MTRLMFPLLGLALGSHPLSWLAVYGLCAAQVAWLFSRVGTFRRGVALGYPVPLIFYFIVFARSLRRSRTQQTVAWKGRQIRAD